MNASATPTTQTTEFTVRSKRTAAGVLTTGIHAESLAGDMALPSQTVAKGAVMQHDPASDESGTEGATESEVVAVAQEAVEEETLASTASGLFGAVAASSTLAAPIALAAGGVALSTDNDGGEGGEAKPEPTISGISDGQVELAPNGVQVVGVGQSSPIQAGQITLDPTAPSNSSATVLDPSIRLLPTDSGAVIAADDVSVLAGVDQASLMGLTETDPTQVISAPMPSVGADGLVLEGLGVDLGPIVTLENLAVRLTPDAVLAIADSLQSGLMALASGELDPGLTAVGGIAGADAMSLGGEGGGLPSVEGVVTRLTDLLPVEMVPAIGGQLEDGLKTVGNTLDGVLGMLTGASPIGAAPAPFDALPLPV